MSHVIACDVCGDLAVCRREFNPLDFVYVDVCSVCETDYLKKLESDFRDYHGLTLEEE